MKIPYLSPFAYNMRKFASKDHVDGCAIQWARQQGYELAFIHALDDLAEWYYEISDEKAVFFLLKYGA